MCRAGGRVIVFLLLMLATIAGASDKLDSFDSLSAEEQLKLAKKKCKKKDGYATCKVGRYTIYSEVGPVRAYRWGLILDNYTDESIDDGIFPSKLNKRGTPPQVFFLRGWNSYDRTIQRVFNMPAPANSGAVFIRDGKKAGLFMYYDDKNAGTEESAIDPDAEALVQECTLHEATHQMVYYHISMDVPTWFDEGLAMNMETYNTSMGFKANLHDNMYKTDRAYFVCDVLQKGGSLVSFPELFTMSHDTWNRDLSMSAMKGHLNYASAWLACNFFFTCKKGRKFVGKYIKALKSGGSDKASRMLDTKDLRAIDEDIREHLQKVVLPSVKYGRQILKAIGEKNFTVAGKATEAMLKEFPESTEAKFYQQWLAILDEGKSKDDMEAAVEKLDDICDKDSDFYHPQMNYVLALGYFKADDKTKARKYIKKACKDNSRDAAVKQLDEQIDKM